MKSSERQWTPSEDESLRVWYRQGKTAKAIAAMLERTEGAVRGRASTLGLKRGEQAESEETGVPEVEYETAGVCVHCGQAHIAVYSGLSRTERDEKATRECNCPAAERERTVARQVENGTDRVRRLLGDEAEREGFAPINNEAAVCGLIAAMKLVAEETVLAVTVQVDGMNRVKIGMTAKGEIKVERSETKVQKMGG